MRFRPKDHIAAQSLAGWACFYAIRTWNGSVPLERWVQRFVRQQTWAEHRKRQLPLCDEWQQYEVSVVDIPTSDIIPQEDWQILWENHVDKWPVDVVARRHGWSTPFARKRLQAARSRFAEAMRDANTGS